MLHCGSHHEILHPQITTTTPTTNLSTTQALIYTTIPRASKARRPSLECAMKRKRKKWMKQRKIPSLPGRVKRRLVCRTLLLFLRDGSRQSRRGARAYRLLRIEPPVQTAELSQSSLAIDDEKESMECSVHLKLFSFPFFSQLLSTTFNTSLGIITVIMISIAIVDETPMHLGSATYILSGRP